MRVSAITPAGRTNDTGGARTSKPAGAGRPRAAATTSARPRPARAAATSARPRPARDGAATKPRSTLAPPARKAGRPTDRAGRTSIAGAVGPRQRPRLKKEAPFHRRVSGPVRRERERPGRDRSRSAAAGPRGVAVLAPRAGAFLRSLPDHALIDRLVRGQAWIPVLGVMLAGIVFMQVEVLKLGAGVGRSIEATSGLTSRNQALRASVASLSDVSRIERLAAGMGMIMPAPGSVGFLTDAGNGKVTQAMANIHTPSASTFLAAQTGNGAIATNSIMSPSDGSISADAPGGSTSGSTTSGSTTSGSTGTSGTSGPSGAASLPGSASSAASSSSQSGGSQQSGATADAAQSGASGGG